MSEKRKYVQAFAVNQVNEGFLGRAITYAARIGATVKVSQAVGGPLHVTMAKLIRDEDSLTVRHFFQAVENFEATMLNGLRR